MLAQFEQASTFAAWAALPHASAPPSAAAAARFRENEPTRLRALDEDCAGHFRIWRGVSGRRYVVSVYDGETCPAYCYAVLIGVTIGADGRSRIRLVEDTGAFPEPVLARAKAALAADDGRTEFHIHLLAKTAGARADVVADVTAAGFSAEC